MVACDDPQQQLTWLVLFYLDVESPELIEPAKAELLELLQPEIDPRIGVFVQLTGLQFEGRNFRGTRRYQIRDRSLCELQNVRNYRRSSARSLKDFIVEVLRATTKASLLADTTRKLLVIWGHGAGVGLGLEPLLGGRMVRRALARLTEYQPSGRALRVAQGAAESTPFFKQQFVGRDTASLLSGAVDVSTATVIEDALIEANREEAQDKTTKIKQVTTQESPRPLDLVIFDSCFMSSAEVAYQLRKVTRYFIASQGNLGFPGLDLTRLLVAVRDAAEMGHAPDDKDAARKRDRHLLELGKRIVNQAIELDAGALGLSLYRLQRLGKCIAHDPATDPACAITPDCNEAPVDPRCKEANQEQGVRKFRDALRDLVEALRLGVWRENLRRQIRRAFRDASTLDVRQFIDLADLATRLQSVTQAKPDCSTWESAVLTEEALKADPVREQIATHVTNAGISLEAAENAYAKIRAAVGDALEDDAARIRRAAEELEKLLADPTQFLAYHQARRRASGEEQGVSIYCPWFQAADGDRPRGRDVRVDVRVYSRLDLCRPWPEAGQFPTPSQALSKSNAYKSGVGTGWADFIYTTSGHVPGSPVSSDAAPCLESLLSLMSASPLGRSGPPKNDGQAREAEPFDANDDDE